MSPDEILNIACEYKKIFTVKEPKERATSIHAMDLCKHCGKCVSEGKRSELCPNKLTPAGYKGAIEKFTES